MHLLWYSLDIGLITRILIVEQVNLLYFLIPIVKSTSHTYRRFMWFYHIIKTMGKMYSYPLRLVRALVPLGSIRIGKFLGTEELPPPHLSQPHQLIPAPFHPSSQAQLIPEILKPPSPPLLIPSPVQSIRHIQRIPAPVQPSQRINMSPASSIPAYSRLNLSWCYLFFCRIISLVSFPDVDLSEVLWCDNSKIESLLLEATIFLIHKLYPCLQTVDKLIHQVPISKLLFNTNIISL